MTLNICATKRHEDTKEKTFVPFAGVALFTEKHLHDVVV
jgi:hypothetical protein